MKRIIFVFMFIGLVSAVSATHSEYPSDKGTNPTDNKKQPMTFTLRLNNQASVKFDFVLTNVVTNQTHTYTVNSSSLDYDYNFPEGTYDIQITPESIPPTVVYFSVEAGCSPFVEVFDTSITLHNIMLNSSCNEIWTAFEHY